MPPPHADPVRKTDASTAIVGFRRDLRLSDQPALQAALDAHHHGLPVFIADDAAEQSWAPRATGGCSTAWPR